MLQEIKRLESFSSGKDAEGSQHGLCEHCGALSWGL